MDWSEFAIFVGTGLLAGSWGALIGAGGGFIIVPLLLFFHKDLSIQAVSAVSLVAVFANGLSGTAVYARLRRIDYRSGIIFLLAMIPGGISGALLVNHISRGLFLMVFGILLILVAIYVTARPKQQPKLQSRIQGTTRRVIDSRGINYEYKLNLKLGTFITFLVGFMASTLGIGGGIINVPAFIYILGMPIQVATATSQFIVVGTSAAASATNLFEGDLVGRESIILPLTIGTVIGAQMGARISQHVSTVWVTRILGTGLLVVGVRLVYLAFP